MYDSSVPGWVDIKSQHFYHSVLSTLGAGNETTALSTHRGLVKRDSKGRV